MTKMIGNSPFIYDDAGKTIVGVQNPDGSVGSIVSNYPSLSAAARSTGVGLVGDTLYPSVTNAQLPFANLANITTLVTAKSSKIANVANHMLSRMILTTGVL